MSAEATPPTEVTLDDVRRAAAERLGYATLRPGQAEACAAVVSGCDALLVMPTGGGKSAVYQLATAMLGGPTVVISPLIALQQEQAEIAAGLGIGEVAALNSRMSPAARRSCLSGLSDGRLAMVFLAPEQLANAETRAAFGGMRPSLFVIDEAHCISEWGHDFRTDYLMLAEAIAAAGHPPVLALTATASPQVREEICLRLGLQEADVIVRGVDRPNLRLDVEPFNDPALKHKAVLETVLAGERPGIVYAAERRTCEEMASTLVERGVAAAAYHGGLNRAEREEVHQGFLDDSLEVVVATVAFGMGIDKPDVRFVLHLDVPPSLDEYYQEIGRAGRDGRPAEAHLFWRAEDLSGQAFAGGSRPLEEADIGAVLVVLERASGAVPLKRLVTESRLNRSKAQRVVACLADVGAITFASGRGPALRADAPPLADVLAAAREREERRQRWERSRVDMMRAYPAQAGCRRRYLLAYFGEPAADTCGNCDACERMEATDDADRTAAAPAPDEDTPFAEQSRVRHAEFGDGTVLQADADTMTVLFDDKGYTRLDTDLVTEHDLLDPAPEAAPEPRLA